MRLPCIFVLAYAFRKSCAHDNLMEAPESCVASSSRRVLCPVICIVGLRPEAKSDLVNVLSRLEAHWVVLEAELVEINKDITFSEQCVQKYGYAPQIVRCCRDGPSSGLWRPCAIRFHDCL